MQAKTNNNNNKKRGHDETTETTTTTTATDASTSIIKYITVDLLSKDKETVGESLENLSSLLEDSVGDTHDSYVKKILSCAGHMIVLSALQKYIGSDSDCSDSDVSCSKQEMMMLLFDGVFVLYNLLHGNMDAKDAIRSAGGMETIMKAIMADIDNANTVECGLALLRDLVDSQANAIEFINTSLPGLHCNNSGGNNECNNSNCPKKGGLGLVLKCMQSFPVGCCDGWGIGDCICGKNEVHWQAISTIRKIARDEDMRFNIIHCGVATEVSKVLQEVCTPGHIKSPLEWMSMEVLRTVCSVPEVDVCMCHHCSDDEDSASEEEDSVTQSENE